MAGRRYLCYQQLLHQLRPWMCSGSVKIRQGIHHDRYFHIFLPRQFAQKFTTQQLQQALQRVLPTDAEFGWVEMREQEGDSFFNHGYFSAGVASGSSQKILENTMLEIATNWSDSLWKMMEEELHLGAKPMQKLCTTASS